MARICNAYMVGDRHERYIHPYPSRREIYIRPAIHPDPAPLPIGVELLERIATVVETYGPRALRLLRRALRAPAIANALCVGTIIGAIGYFGWHLLRAVALR